MNLSELFVRRPVMTVLVMAGILIFGLASYRMLTVSSLPNVDFPTIQVSAQLPGASPETMAAAVATPLEKQFSTIAGIDQMTSLSGQGRSEEHTSELQSLTNLVCRLLLEKKKKCQWHTAEITEHHITKSEEF